MCQESKSLMLKSGGLFSVFLFYMVWLLALGSMGCQKSPEEIAKIQKETLEQTPVLVSTQDGVKLWRVVDKHTGLWVYFTTPGGDAQWTVPGDEDNPPKHFQVPGARKTK